MVPAYGLLVVCKSAQSIRSFCWGAAAGLHCGVGSPEELPELEELAELDALLDELDEPDGKPELDVLEDMPELDDEEELDELASPEELDELPGFSPPLRPLIMT